MEIVENPLKIDLHIRSINSYNKDFDTVEASAVENSDILWVKLVETNLDVFAITDHNTFNGSLKE